MSGLDGLSTTTADIANNHILGGDVGEIDMRGLEKLGEYVTDSRIQTVTMSFYNGEQVMAPL